MNDFIFYLWMLGEDDDGLLAAAFAFGVVLSVSISILIHDNMWETKLSGKTISCWLLAFILIPLLTMFAHLIVITGILIGLAEVYRNLLKEWNLDEQ